MPTRIPISSELLAWAAHRSRISREKLEHRFPRFSDWESGQTHPTFRQLEEFANTTHTPLGYLFLSEPPAEALPVPDFRTINDEQIEEPSPDLLETIYHCQQRQEWYREYAIAEDSSPLQFVSSLESGSPVVDAANTIRHAIGFDVSHRAKFQNWEYARRGLIDLIEDTGVLVMVSGIVGSNTHRKLDPTEFRGFALADPLAPVIFVNGADTKAAQIFTLLHELVHIWVGESGISDASLRNRSNVQAERWANRVAAEILVPESDLKQTYRGECTVAELERLARVYRVSTLVVLKKIFDSGLLEWNEYSARYDEEYARVRSILEERQNKSGSGGNYYYSQPIRISRHFARAVITDALEGRTLYRDAYRLLGTSRHDTFVNLASELGVA